MIEEMIYDYLTHEGRLYHGEIENVSTAGDMVIFQDYSKCGVYKEQRMIPLLDILAWVWSGARKDNKDE